MEACAGLARADTNTGILEWYNSPITDLPKWIEIVNALEKRRKK